jgi:hypothetical protein
LQPSMPTVFPNLSIVWLILLWIVMLLCWVDVVFGLWMPIALHHICVRCFVLHMCLKPISASGYLTGPYFGVFNRIKVNCDGFLQLIQYELCCGCWDFVSFIFYQLLHLMYFWPYSLTIADCNIAVVCVGLDPIHCVHFDHSLVCYNFLLLQQWRSILCALRGLFDPTYSSVLDRLCRSLTSRMRLPAAFGHCAKPREHFFILAL